MEWWGDLVSLTQVGWLSVIHRTVVVGARVVDPTGSGRIGDGCHELVGGLVSLMQVGQLLVVHRAVVVGACIIDPSGGQRWWVAHGVGGSRRWWWGCTMSLTHVVVDVGGGLH